MRMIQVTIIEYDPASGQRRLVFTDHRCKKEYVVRLDDGFNKECHIVIPEDEREMFELRPGPIVAELDGMVFPDANGPFVKRSHD